MSNQDPLKGSRADWLADRVLRGLIGSAMRMPFERRVAFVGGAVSRALGPMVGYRRRAEANLAMIYPNMGSHARRRIARAVCDNFGRTLIENYSHEELHTRLRGTQIDGAGLDHLDNARVAGRPVIFVTGHFGNHEVPRHVLTAQGHQIGGLFRKMANPYFNDHYAKTMTSWGGPVFAQGRQGTMGFARHIKGGGMGTLLFDVHRADGVAVDFLGKPAMTATSAADIALKFNALVLPYFATRHPDGLSFAVEIETPIKHDTPVAMTRDMTDRLATRIAQHPAQWFWVHRRWKSPRPV